MRFKYLSSLFLVGVMGLSMLLSHVLFPSSQSHAALQSKEVTKGMRQILPKSVSSGQQHSALLSSHGWSVMPTTNSLYEVTTNAQTLYAQGCHAAQSSAGLVILDWGQPVYIGNGQYGTYDFGGHDDSDDAILHASANFALGAWSCRTPSTNIALALGESNYYSGNALPLTPATWYADGQQWGQLVNGLHNFVSDNHYNVMGIYGAGDLETGWQSFSLTSSLVNGYNNTSSLVYFDFGDDAPGYWTNYQTWYIAYGARDNLPLPEIYYNADATYDWQALDVWACSTMGGPMYIRGVMSTSIGNTPVQAWTAMYQAGASNACTARTLPWLTFSTYIA